MSCDIYYELSFSLQLLCGRVAHTSAVSAKRLESNEQIEAFKCAGREQRNAKASSVATVAQNSVSDHVQHSAGGKGREQRERGHGEDPACERDAEQDAR